MQRNLEMRGVPLMREEFVDIINRLHESSKLVDKVDALFRESRENVECDFCNGAGLQISHEGIVVKLLEKLMRDRNENISYFIYELDYGEKYQEGCIINENGKIDISTPKKLYDFLVTEYHMEGQNVSVKEENIEDKNYSGEIKLMVEGMKDLSKQAYAVYKPMVEDICSRKTVSEKELENLLDWLVSICISDEMLGLFKQVGRKFYNQYPEIITDYVKVYKEMYGEDV